MPYKNPEQQKAAQARHYQFNKDKYSESRRKSYERYKEYTLSYLEEHPCVDCGEADPVVLEFDHRDPSEKTFSISEYTSNRPSLTRLATEIAKCDVRCANCHRRKTYNQFGYTRKHR